MRPDVRERVLATEAAVTQQLSQVPDWIWDGKSLPVPLETIADSVYGLLVTEQVDLARAPLEHLGEAALCQAQGRLAHLPGRELQLLPDPAGIEALAAPVGVAAQVCQQAEFIVGQWAHGVGGGGQPG